MRKFSPQNLGRGIFWRCKSERSAKVFSTEKRIFHQFAKVFSLESFPLYGICLRYNHPERRESCFKMYLQLCRPCMKYMLVVVFQQYYNIICVHCVPGVHIDGFTFYVVQSPVRTRTPTSYLDFKLDPGATVTQPVTEGWLNNYLSFISWPSYI